MNESQKAENAHRKIERDTDMSCSCELVDELGEEMEAAVSQSVARFLTANRMKIQASSREKIATASYGGGMMDMAMLVRHALGRWALEQLLIELESWIEDDDDEDSEVFVSGKVNTSGGEEISSEHVSEAANRVGSWISDKKITRRQSDDPMFA